MDETSFSLSSTPNEPLLPSVKSLKPTITETKSNTTKLMLIIDDYKFQFGNFKNSQTIVF